MSNGPVGSFPREMELGGRRGYRKEGRKKVMREGSKAGTPDGCSMYSREAA